MFKKVVEYLYKPASYWAILVSTVLVLTLQNYLLSPNNPSGGGDSTYYSNYLIFIHSFTHLIHHQDLYQNFPAEHCDLFKYSPTFALLMAPFNVVPTFVGLLFWNLLNAFLLFFAIRRLPVLNEAQKLGLSGFLLIEAYTSLLNSQSNCLIAGLILFTFLLLEKKQLLLAALFVAFSTYIKIFGVVAFLLFLFYPGKARAVLYSICWMLLLGILPLLVVSPAELLGIYKSWGHLLIDDHSASYGFSVMGWLHSWFNLHPAKLLVSIIGLVGICLPLLRVRLYKQLPFRLLYLASLLIWVVIFNHKAESPSFIIAVSGVAIWYYYQPRSIPNKVLLALTFIFTVLPATDLFPPTVRTQIMIPHVVKVFPCILVWIRINYDLFRMKTETPEPTLTPA